MAASRSSFAKPTPFAAPSNVIGAHLTGDLDLSVEAVAQLLDLAGEIKRTPARFAQALAGRYISYAVRETVAANAHDF